MFIQVKSSYRSGNLVGMAVRNKDGVDLGRIEELVVDLKTGSIAYAALAVGGFMGVRSKVYAIPIEALALKYDERATYFVLDMAPEKLKMGSGFDRNNWPDKSSDDWREAIERDYEKAQRGAKVGVASSTSDNGAVVTSDARDSLNAAQDESKRPSHAFAASDEKDDDEHDRDEHDRDDGDAVGGSLGDRRIGVGTPK